METDKLSLHIRVPLGLTFLMVFALSPSAAVPIGFDEFRWLCQVLASQIRRWAHLTRTISVLSSTLGKMRMNTPSRTMSVVFREGRGMCCRNREAPGHQSSRIRHWRARLTMSAKFIGSALNSGRGILPRRSGWKPLPLFRWIPTEHFKAGIET